MPAVNVRTFNGTTDRIRLAAGGADSGFGSYIAVALRNSTTAGAFLASSKATVAGPTELGVSSVGGGNGIFLNNGTQSNGQALVTADGWAIVVITKATGSATPRHHLNKLPSPSWTHQAGSAALANSTAGTGWDIGAWSTAAGAGQEFFTGSIYLVGYWDAVVLSDAQIETFTSVAAIIMTAPTSLWILNQPTTATAVNDFMKTTANQSSISGTTVAGDTIPNFDPVTPYPPALAMMGCGAI